MLALRASSLRDVRVRRFGCRGLWLLASSLHQHLLPERELGEVEGEGGGVGGCAAAAPWAKGMSAETR